LETGGNALSSLLNNLTSRDAVLEAIRICDEKGRAEFLAFYGYKPARTYVLQHDGHEYDSKAIVGVAYGIQHGTPLKPVEFSGGEKTVVRCLARLGFLAVEAPHPALSLVRGSTYFRKDLVARYGGQLQSGIWTPKDFPAIFLFTGDSGKTYGYHDDWKDGVFQYTGEGQNGPMTFTGGNKAIRDHRANGKDLLLFRDLGKGKGVRYEGLFECASWSVDQRPDKAGNDRQAIIFSLVPVTTDAHAESLALTAVTEPAPAQTLTILRAAAYEAAVSQQERKTPFQARQSWFRRSEAVKRYVLARANGRCEACELPAPFMKKEGGPYLEPHHTQRLADDGPDHPKWVGAICPNCHRRIHSGEDGKDWNTQLQERLKILEPEIEH
jgi:5-methylcytosine-specific restriction protein A